MIKHLLISLGCVTLTALSLHATEPSVKISLGIRDTKLLMITNVTWPLAFRIENSGPTAIRGGELAGIFAQGTLHILPNDGPEQHCPLGEEWELGYGLVPHDLPPGQTAECSVTGDVRTFFPSAKDGEYSVWWTLGDLKSNVSHFAVTAGKVSAPDASTLSVPVDNFHLVQTTIYDDNVPATNSIYVLLLPLHEGAQVDLNPVVLKKFDGKAIGGIIEGAVKLGFLPRGSVLQVDPSPLLARLPDAEVKILTDDCKKIGITVAVSLTE